jgi:hypothetical protein
LNLERSSTKLGKVHNRELHNLYVRSKNIQGREMKGEMCGKTVCMLALEVYIRIYLEISKEINHLRNLDVGRRIIIL